ncbi:unnamed protein product [Moneuplotes crassus]|uniref:Glycoside hydrolase family 38 N-terminal domain-containing protein n=1 Tax=Euplotes crassus TaxID=5936 RepID=A0AAD1U2Q6_EUPCR|nr:unnamed protein product [Moneuplotes crassus]
MALNIKYGVLLGLCILVAAQDLNLTIHGIAHSHNRPGLQMPPEKYYQEYTHKILDNVVAALEKDQSKVFHWDDIASFEKWIYRYPSTDYSKLTRIRKLIKEGRFVFVGGGFVMNDEALPSYKETMLQMRIGRKFLDHYFGIKPTIAWQIGSIGHSAATISVLSKLGYEAIVGNKISSDYKKKLEDEYGFNFYWQGHQVSENRQDDVLLTHILTNDYTSLDAGDEGMVIKSNIQTEKASIYAENIVPSLTSAEVLSNNQTTSIHSMVCLGGDHFFVRAPELFKKYDELLEGLKTEATEVGMKVDAKYSSLYDYFEGLHNSESTFGLFKGDFLPYNEPNEQSEDFWTGYYSTRVQNIRYAFNQLHGLKIILGIIQTSRGTLVSNLGSKKMHRNQYNLNQYIEMAEKKWSSLLHHYAISGIFDQETEKSYSKSYNETLNLIDISLQHLLNSSYPVYKLYNDSFMTKFSQNYSYPSCFDLVYVNPSAFKRHEVMNITIPDEYKNKIVYLILETTLGSKSPSSYITDLYEIDEQTHEMVKVTKLFFELEMEGLSTARLYMYPYGGSTRCALDFINCAEKVTSRIVKGEHHIRNDYTWLSFDENGNLKEIISGQGSDAEEQPIEEQINYYKTDKPSRSSQYTFNPMEEKVVMEFDFSEMHEHEIGNLVRILQVYCFILLINAIFMIG